MSEGQWTVDKAIQAILWDARAKQAIAYLTALEERAGLADEMAAALQDLEAEQNGPPLMKHQTTWQAAMTRVSDVLVAYALLKAKEVGQ